MVDTAQTPMHQFQQQLESQLHTTFSDYPALHQWSLQHPELFWRAVWDFTGMIASQQPQQIFQPGKTLRDGKWFVGASLNYAENCLRRDDNHPAIIFNNERGDIREISFATLKIHVASMAHHLSNIGVKPNDRIAAFMPNSPETVIAMLATASIGAIWSSCSPDFGLNGLLDRLGQIEPSVLFAVDGQFYKNKAHQHLDKVKQLTTQIPSIKHTIVYNYISEHPDITALPNAIFFNDILKNKITTLDYAQLPFNHPLVILYSSGTTGQPKCLVHGAGNTLIQHLKELVLHSDIRKNDRLFFHTTCGWMMWNWMLSALAADATLVLYDGSPLHPNTEILFDIIDKTKVTHFGCGAKYIESIEKLHVKPIKTHDLSSLRCILTTASPLLPKSFDYVYRYIKQDIQLASESGGSDIISCFALGNPTLPVYRGELQCLGLGMAVEIYNDDSQSVLQQKGELVCTQAFPSMPLYFWDDPDGKKYFNAYFNKFPNVWAHGDYAEITSHHGMIIYGRSDTTLNPGGIRIGTAEIYRQVEKLDEIIESLAVGQQWQDSERVILFVVLRPPQQLDETLINKIKVHLRNNASPHHVPSKVIQVKELPRTVSGKVVELAVKHLIHGEPVKNKGALANPDCLEAFCSDAVKAQLAS